MVVATGDKELPKRVKAVLIWLHVITILIHCFSGTYGLYINMQRTDLVDDAQKLSWETVSWYDKTLIPEDISPVDGCNVRELPGGGRTVFTNECTGSFNGILSLSACKYITAFFHIIYLVEIVSEKYPAHKFWQKSFNQIRWLEYSCTATLLTLAQFVPLGLRSESLIIYVGLTFPVVLLLGGAAERLQAITLSLNPSNDHGSIYRSLRMLKYVAFALAFLIQGAVFVLIAIALARSTGEGTSDSNDWLWRVVASSYYIFYFSFVVNFSIWLFGAGKIYKHFYQCELVYIILSTSSKTSLFWLIAGAVEYTRTTSGAWETVIWLAASIPLGVALLLPPLLMWYLRRDIEQPATVTLIKQSSLQGMQSSTATELDRLLDSTVQSSSQ